VLGLQACATRLGSKPLICRLYISDTLKHCAKTILDLSPGFEKIDSHFSHQEIYWELGERDKEGDGVSKKQENIK
jgi:hypothetical protein